MNRRTQRNLWLAILLAMLVPMVGGCLPVTATDYDRLYAANEAYGTSLDVYEGLLDAGVIKTQRQAAPFKAAREEVAEILADAKAKLDAGDTIGFRFLLERFQIALGKYRQHLSRVQALPEPSMESDDAEPSAVVPAAPYRDRRGAGDSPLGDGGEAGAWGAVHPRGARATAAVAA